METLTERTDLINRLIKCFEDSGMTYREVSDLSGIAYNQVCDFMNGRYLNPTLDTLMRYVKALKFKNCKL